MWKYDPKSKIADEFINHEEIMETLAYAEAHKSDTGLMRDILQKARERKGLNHREASVLLANENPEIDEEIFALAKQLKQDLYVNIIVVFGRVYFC